MDNQEVRILCLRAVSLASFDNPSRAMRNEVRKRANDILRQLNCTRCGGTGEISYFCGHDVEINCPDCNGD